MSKFAVAQSLPVAGPNWDDVSEDAKSFVWGSWPSEAVLAIFCHASGAKKCFPRPLRSQLLDRDVSARPAAREASRHEWLQEQPQPGFLGGGEGKGVEVEEPRKRCLGSLKHRFRLAEADEWKKRK